MKSVWVINFFSGSHLSGWGERHFYFAKHWAINGARVCIFSSSYNHMFNYFPKLDGVYTEEIIDEIKFIWVKTPSYHAKSPKRFWSMLVFAWRVFKYKITIENKPDVVIVSSMPIFSIWAGLQIKRKCKAKLIFEIRDIWPLTLQLLGEKTKWHPFVLFLGWFERIGYQNADTIVSLLPNSRLHIERIAKKKVDFNYIPNGIDEILDFNKNENLDALLLIPKNKFIVGYVGTLGLANAMSFLIDAAIGLFEHSDIHFVIVGDGYMKEDLMRRSNGKANITFIPKVKKSEVQLIIEKFDLCFIGWHNSELYKFGVSANKYFDYMLAKKPILVSSRQLGDPVEICGCGLKVEPESEAAIRVGILKLMLMTIEDRLVLGEKGRNYVLENHSIKNLAKKYSDLF